MTLTDTMTSNDIETLCECLIHTSQGLSFTPASLATARNLPEITSLEQRVLDRYLSGGHTYGDKLRLQNLALRIRTIYRSQTAGARKGFIAQLKERNHGSIREQDLPAIIAEDRLCPVLVRTSRCRFTAPAQDVAYLIDLIENAPGDYLRDVSFAQGGAA